MWDEFYGSGKEGPRKGKGATKGKGKGKKKAEAEDGDEDGEEDYSVLKALILKKRENAGAFLDNLAAKYADAEPKPRSKGKRKKDTSSGEVDESPKKRRRGAEADPEDIDDEEFAKLQQKMFKDKDKGAEAGKSTGKHKRAGRARKP